MNKILCFILFLVVTTTVHAFQVKDSLAIAVDKDSTLIVKHFDTNFEKKYTGEEYNYSSNQGAPQNLLLRALNWASNSLRDAFGFNVSLSTLKILEIIIYILMGGLFVFLLIRFFIGERMGALFAKKATSITDINLNEEHIENIDIDRLFQEALTAKEYRLAIRYQYLKTLKLLASKELISWDFDKTNTDYLNEISSIELKKAFKKVSYVYDYIWYGEFNIDETMYNTANLRFIKINSLLKS